MGLKIQGLRIHLGLGVPLKGSQRVLHEGVT